MRKIHELPQFLVLPKWSFFYFTYSFFTECYSCCLCLSGKSLGTTSVLFDFKNHIRQRSERKNAIQQWDALQPSVDLMTSCNPKPGLIHLKTRGLNTKAEVTSVLWLNRTSLIGGPQQQFGIYPQRKCLCGSLGIQHHMPRKSEEGSPT